MTVRQFDYTYARMAAHRHIDVLGGVDRGQSGPAHVVMFELSSMVRAIMN